MKATKKLFKQVFGAEASGIDYLKLVYKKQKAPVLFVKGKLAASFGDWLTKIPGGAAVVDKAKFLAEYAALPQAYILVKDVPEVDEAVIRAAMNARKAGKNVIVTTLAHPKALDYVSDPAFKVIEVNDFDMAVNNEIEELKKAIV